MLKVEALENGLVIDHIAAGRGLELYQRLRLDRCRGSVSLLQRVRSDKYVTKDMIKIEGDTLPPDLSMLACIDPQITLIEIRDGKVVRKWSPDKPERLENVIRCTNPRCIAGAEPECRQIFLRTAAGRYRCAYCEQEATAQSWDMLWEKP
ncbi:MAG: aspartate carbamoyltransferase regulatory subunit [Gemmiger sp.]|uniref:aspartate carbamoyltransferase regulatory subunit n=1 Tax=Gemmiger sp. TaxID=2049027 RepID=UPI002E771D56|nr:aspartate carbamoyltransferase regulatory subunit [Gemmiger sp.]MEE0801298.1 aspartate carbamoyltransferase regulatory subunit [Gemmiger sp.]